MAVFGVCFNLDWSYRFFYIVDYCKKIMDDKLIMVNLGDEKAKEISEVIGSKSCNKVLNLLAEGDLTVSDVASKLKMPINTVDYNVKKLVKAGLIEKASHFWSVKGKKMPTYRVSNRKIIISPRKSVARVFAWTIGLTGLMALTIREFFGGAVQFAGSGMRVSELVAEDAAFVELKNKAVIGVSETLSTTSESAPVILDGASKSGAGLLSFVSGVSAWEWFLIGAWFAVFIFFVTTLINDQRHRL